MANRICVKAGNYQQGDMAIREGIILPSGNRNGKWSLIIQLWDYADQHKQLVFTCDSKGAAIDTLDMVAKKYPSKYGTSIGLDDL